jgi:hypothetical protein
MYKDLLDYNGVVNTWIRANRKEAIGLGFVLNAVLFIAISAMIHEAAKKEQSN